MFIFHRLKINHDSHEFFLEFGTVADSLFLTLTWARPGRRPGTEEGQRLLHGRKGNKRRYRKGHNIMVRAILGMNKDIKPRK
jgi:hypothetical protein